MLKGKFIIEERSRTTKRKMVAVVYLRGCFSFSIVPRRFGRLLVFTSALILRALPEFLSGFYPVGFDTVAGYVPAIVALPEQSPINAFGWTWSPLAVYLLWFVRFVTGMDPYLLLKVASPVFCGILAVSFHYLLSHGLEWDSKKSFVVALLFLLQPAVLRTGWDQLREELGLSFFFLLLAKTKCDVVLGAGSKPATVLALSILTVLSHQLAAVLLFVVVLWQMFRDLTKRDGGFSRSCSVVLPSAVIFVWQLYNQFITPSFSSRFAPIQLPKGTNIFVFSNYFLSDPRFLDGDYLKILAYVGSLSLYCAVPLVPLALKGFSRDNSFTPILIWLSIASYSILVCPKYSFSEYWWWSFLLPIPLTVFAGNGLDRLGIFAAMGSKLRKKIFWAAFFLLGVVAFGYATSTIRLGYPFATSYMPSGLVESAIPHEDVEDVKAAFGWVNEKAVLNSVVIVTERTMGLAYLDLRTDILIRVAPSLLQLNDVVALVSLVQNRTYAVWDARYVGEDAFPWSKMAEFGKIAVFQVADI